MTRILLLLSLLAAAPAAAQARYLPQPDTLYYEALNPHRMYFVRGRDTLGTPIRGYSVSRQTWQAAGDGLRVDQHHELIQVDGRVRGEVFDLSPRGVVRTIDGDPAKPKGQFDLVLRLPVDGDLRVGRVWHDTVDQTAPDGEYIYRTLRELRVERIADTLGGRMAVVRGTGRTRYRQTERMDSTAARSWWIDVEGPVDETFLFDVDRGRMAAREWWMDLRGTSGVPRAGGGVDTLPAGLLSMDTTRLVDAERARLQARALPAGDTSVTWEGRGAALLHAVRREGQTIESAMRRNDGATIHVSAGLADGHVVRYELLYTTPHEPPLRRRLEAATDFVRVTGTRDTVVTLPEGAWTVADYGMDEYLAPLVARMGMEGRTAAEISVLRPYGLRWDSRRLQVLALDDAFAGVLSAEGENAVTLLLVSPKGDLIYMENAHASRHAPEGSPRALRTAALIRQLNEMAKKRP
jgi:hypothetical protein